MTVPYNLIEWARHTIFMVLALSGKKVNAPASIGFDKLEIHI